MVLAVELSIPHRGRTRLIPGSGPVEGRNLPLVRHRQIASAMVATCAKRRKRATEADASPRIVMIHGVAAPKNSLMTKLISGWPVTKMRNDSRTQHIALAIQETARVIASAAKPTHPFHLGCPSRH